MKPQFIVQKLLPAIYIIAGSSFAHAAPNGYILKVNMTPALCRLDDTQKRTRQCLEGYAMTVTGLLPEGVNPKTCATSSIPNFTPVQKRLLTRIMPDEVEQRRLWRTIGGCVSMSATQYFRAVLNHADHLKIPSEVTPPNSVWVNRLVLRQRFAQLNPGMSNDGVYFTCAGDRYSNAMLLTHINICYNSAGKYRPCEGARVLTCPNVFIVQGGY